MKTKPFCLKEALAGNPVVTADGREVTQVKHFDVVSSACVYGVIEWRVYSFTNEGHFLGEQCKIGGPFHPLNLRMKDNTRQLEAWVNIYPNGLFGCYKTEQEAKANANSLCLGQHYISVEVDV